ncbi:Pyrroline-5-carboxylate reductase [hydrothermal vent metagenome]|uniref:Pyrroline-5-carboxylate reductase n=1 Tax=hydrothermal vent metagenome TaxID=652676 RepID=A0A1W1D2G6_9ZZZZ
MKITFIGNGNMALSIAQGLKKQYEIEVVGRDFTKLELFEKKLGIKIQKHLLEHFDISNKNLLLCVKPANIKSVGEQFVGEANVVFSVLAGTTIDAIQTHIKTKSVVRAMPNLAASVQKSMTTLTGDEAYKEEAQKLFYAIGQTRWLGSEKEIDIATALAGSGPAYLALVAEALADGAVREGLKREDAMHIMRGLFDGFGTLIQDENPALLKDKVMSPGGTTAAGYGALEENGVRYGCMSAIEKAYQKALQLAK